MLGRRATLTLLATAATAAAARAQAFPDQPVRLIIPFPPGGPADLIGRIIGRGMGERLGRPVVIDSRSGAGGTVGIDAVAKARPDGHTIGLASTGAMVILPHMMAAMPYNPLRDLAPVGLVLAVPQILAVAPDVPARSIAELVALAKAKPGELTYGSAGIGSSLHLAAELFRLRAGIDVTHVPYRGAAPAITDLIAGRIQFILADVPVMLPQLRAGAVRGLGVTSGERFAAVPELPVFAEAGLQGVVSETWYGVVAPAATPPERLARLQGVLLETLAEPETRRLLTEQGGRLAALDAAAFAAHISREYAAWGAVVREAGVKME